MNAFQLKLIAFLFMFVDHIGLLFFPFNPTYRWFGRASFPIFAFLLSEGFHKSSNSNKYLYRLLFFAFISQFPFFLISSKLNIFFSLALGLSLFKLNFSLKLKPKSDPFVLPFQIINFSKSLILTAAVSIFADLLNVDYGFYGIILIYLFSLPLKRSYILTLSFIFTAITAYLIPAYQIQLFMFLSFPFLILYNGEKGLSNQRWLYWVYPIHFFILIFIKYGKSIF